MANKSEGLYGKYSVEKISNPKKIIDCIVMEFDDPIARVGIRAWAKEMRAKGFIKCADEVEEKLSWFNAGNER